MSNFFMFEKIWIRIDLWKRLMSKSEKNTQVEKNVTGIHPSEPVWTCTAISVTAWGPPPPPEYAHVSHQTIALRQCHWVCMNAWDRNLLVQKLTSWTEAWLDNCPERKENDPVNRMMTSLQQSGNSTHTAEQPKPVIQRDALSLSFLQPLHTLHI